MPKRRTLRYISLIVSIVVVTAVIVGVMRGNKISERSISVERRIADDGSIYELISTDYKNKLCLRVIRSDGLVTGYYPLPKSSKPGMYTAYHIIGLLGKELFLYQYETPGNTPERTNEAIVAYNMKTGGSRIVTMTAAPGALDTYDIYFAQNTAGNSLYLGYLERQSGYLSLRCADAKSGAVTDFAGVYIPFSLAAISVSETGELFALSQDSHVYMYDGGEAVCVFKPDSNTAVANMTVGESGEVFLFSVSSDGTVAWISAPESRQFLPLSLDTQGLIKLHIANVNNWAALDEDYRYIIVHDGVKTVIERLSASFWVLWDFDGLTVAMLTALVVSGLFVIVRTIVSRRKLYLLPKLLIIIVPAFMIGIFALVSVANAGVGETVEKGLRQSLLEYGNDALSNIDARRFAQIDWSNPYEDDYYLQLRSYIEELSEYRLLTAFSGDSRVTYNAYADYSLYRVSAGKVYTTGGEHYTVGLESKYFEYASSIPERENMLLQKEPVSAVIGGFDSNIRRAVVLIPVLDSGQVVGYLEAARPMTAIDEAVYKMTRSIIIAGLFVSVAVVFVLILILAISTRTLTVLEHGALAISAGDYTARAESRSWDETGEIARAFNKMAESVESAMRRITSVSDSYSRFVPKRLIELLGKDTICSVRPGDHKKLTATHLLLYTDVFDEMADDSFFAALGRFYNSVIPCITSAGGLISRYSPRGLGAMFESTPAQTLESVLSIFSELDRGGRADCYVFLSHSDATFGVIGNGETLCMVTVSRLVYESYRVGMSGKLFGTRIIVPQSAHSDLSDELRRYNHRFLGFMYIDGEVRRLYDFYDCDATEIKLKKNQTKTDFESGVASYYAGEYSKARRQFVEIIKRFPEDTASREYLRRSDAGYKRGGAPLAVLDLT